MEGRAALSVLVQVLFEVPQGLDLSTEDQDGGPLPPSVAALLPPQGVQEAHQARRALHLQAVFDALVDGAAGGQRGTGASALARGGSDSSVISSSSSLTIDLLSGLLLLRSFGCGRVCSFIIVLLHLHRRDADEDPLFGHPGLGCLTKFAGEGSREERQLPIWGYALHDRAKLGLETEGQHAVALVQDQVGDTGERYHAEGEQVQQAARGGRHDLRSSQRHHGVDLHLLPHATVDSSTAQVVEAFQPGIAA
mmetsp:Transcript_59168/g.129961  ORF Transcript_59168/g.129961 Transcript_59168/m.129961 type:complete len:251 (-) Transcript_59168:816-1568(-)